jgi:hypothetical protein
MALTLGAARLADGRETPWVARVPGSMSLLYF